MSLTSPMHAIPGELLMTTELREDVAYNFLWRIPPTIGDISEHLIGMKYGDLWLTLASWRVHDGEGYIWPAVLLHLPTTRIVRFYDIEHVDWLWRPDCYVTDLHKEILEQR